MRFKEHNVLVAQPHPSSLASLVMLTRLLAPKPVSYKVWLRFRKWYIKQHRKQHRKLCCVYCKRNDLLSSTDDFQRLATLDHVIPKSKGGAEYSSNNLVVACFPCNQKKKDNVPL